MLSTQKLYAYAGSLAAGTSLILSGRAWADPINPTTQLAPAGTADFSATTGTDLRTPLASLGNTIITLVFLIAAIVAILFLVYSGIQYITSGGNADKAKIARGGIINSIIGIIIIAAAYGIIHFAVNIGAGVSTATGPRSGGGIGNIFCGITGNC